jgi:hypothetical protein
VRTHVASLRRAGPGRGSCRSAVLARRSAIALGALTLQFGGLALSLRPLPLPGSLLGLVRFIQRFRGAFVRRRGALVKALGAFMGRNPAVRSSGLPILHRGHAVRGSGTTSVNMRAWLLSPGHVITHPGSNVARAGVTIASLGLGVALVGTPVLIGCEPILRLLSLCIVHGAKC